MLAHNYRFHGHGSLKFVFKNGDTLRSKHLVLRISTNPRREQVRAAVVVSKKIYKAAVKRNRIRRRIYEVMRPLVAELPEAYDVAFIVVRPDVLVAPYADLEIEVKDLLMLGVSQLK